MTPSSQAQRETEADEVSLLSGLGGVGTNSLDKGFEAWSLGVGAMNNCETPDLPEDPALGPVCSGL